MRMRSMMMSGAGHGLVDDGYEWRRKEKDGWLYGYIRVMRAGSVLA